MLSPDTSQFLHDALERMVSPVRLVLFTQAIGCDGCLAAGRIVREFAALSDLISVEEHNLVLERKAASAYRVDRAPTIAVVGERDRGLRFVGAPGGYEIMALADAILLASSGDSGLTPESRAIVAAVRAPLDIQVFVTPT
jgi:alkyl hydroperoxide reductase subunit AhpF